MKSQKAEGYKYPALLFFLHLSLCFSLYSPLSLCFSQASLSQSFIAGAVVAGVRRRRHRTGTPNYPKIKPFFVEPCYFFMLISNPEPKI
jgi:hypothetical protein